MDPKLREGPQFCVYQPYQIIEEVKPTELECGFLLDLVKERRESDECHEYHLFWEMSFMPSLSPLPLVLHTTTSVEWRSVVRRMYSVAIPRER